MRIAVTGASGFVGGALLPALRVAGHEVVPLVRQLGARPPARYWNPAAGELDSAHLADCQAVINLAGKNLTDGLWTAARRAEFHASRVVGTTLLARTMAALPSGPRLLISASAVGYYGNQGERELDESCPAGSGFLAELARDWEAAAEPARAAGMRVIHPRFGIMLDPSGSSLKAMLPAFKLGLGGRLGPGTQYFPWISLRDAVSALLWLLQTPDAEGPYNLVAPEPVTNAEFTRALATTLHRPACLPVPALLLRALPGGMGQDFFLNSLRVLPRRLLAGGFQFQDPALAPALARLLPR